jgi:hypothetical protein
VRDNNFGVCNGISLAVSQLIQVCFFAVSTLPIVGIALLSNISVVSSWRSVEIININASGLSPINASIAQYLDPSEYWNWIWSLLESPDYVFPISPTRCSLDINCQSYYFPGSHIDPPMDAFTNHTEGTLFIVDNSIGYLLEYYPPLSTDQIDHTAECGTYGTDSFAFHICLQQADSDLLAGKFFCDFDADPGLSYCPVNASCLTDASWNNEFNYVLKVAISKLSATVVYSRQNDSILNIVDLGTPQPANYTPNDFFPFLEMAGTNETGDNSYIISISQFAAQPDTNNPYQNWFILMSMLAIPVALFNDAY